MKKRLVSIILALTMLIGLVPMATTTVFAETEGDYTYSVSDGKAEITGYFGAGGEVTIPSTLGGYPVTEIGNYAFYDCSGLTSITIPEGVTSIGWYAFSGCSGLTTVYYAGSEEDWVKIIIDSGNGPLTGATIIFNYEPVAASAGDVDGDGIVTSDDAIYLLYYTLLPDLYPVKGNVDFDGDGTVETIDGSAKKADFTERLGMPNADIAFIAINENGNAVGYVFAPGMANS